MNLHSFLFLSIWELPGLFQECFGMASRCLVHGLVIDFYAKVASNLLKAISNEQIFSKNINRDGFKRYIRKNITDYHTQLVSDLLNINNDPDCPQKIINRDGSKAMSLKPNY